MSMASTNIPAGNVAGGASVRMGIEKIVARNVVVLRCARPHTVLSEKIPNMMISLHSYRSSGQTGIKSIIIVRL